MLGDLGAEVIKIEQPGGGDPMRSYEPRIGADSAYTWVADRNKRSVVVDLRSPEGQEVVRRLARRADVFIESFRPGVADRLEVGYERLREECPELVYCALSGYGASGPLVEEPGHDVNYVGRAGVVGTTGVDGRPAIPGVQVADLAGGALGAVAGIMAALWRVQRGGGGDLVDVSMTDGAFALNSIHLGAVFATGKAPGPGEDMLTGALPCYNVYRCADGRWLTVGALEPHFWTRLCEALDRPDLAASGYDPAAIEACRELFAARGRDEWLDQLEGVGTCVGPVNDLAEAIADPQLRAREMIVELDHPELGPLPQVGTPLKFAQHPAGARGAAPALGADTRQVLDEAGYEQREIEALVATGAVEAAGER